MAQYEIAAQTKGPVAYVLAGGASFGSIQVGQMRALADTDLRPDFVVGTSVGSLNGAVIAEAPDTAAERLTDLWATVSRDEVFGGMLSAAMNLASGKPSAIKNDGLRALLERAVNARDFSELEVPHTAMATDFDTGVAVAINEGDLITGLLASAAIPAVFPAIQRDGMRLVDGGLVANVPIGQAVEQGARTIVVLDCGFTVLAPDKEDSFGGRIMRMAAIMAAQQVRRDMDKAEGLTVLYLPGPWPAETRPDDFAKSVELAARAEELTREWLSDLEIDGPGRYGTAPSDALTERKVALSDAARELAEEAGVIPVDEEKIAEKEALREAEEAGEKAGRAAEKADTAAKKAAEAVESAEEAVTAAGEGPQDALAEEAAEAARDAADSARVAADEAKADAVSAGEAAVGAGKKIISKILGQDDGDSEESSQQVPAADSGEGKD